MHNLDKEFAGSSDYAPSPDKFDDIIDTVEEHFGTSPIEYIGAGDNAIALLADNGNVLKFTIDNKEASLWARIGNRQIDGLANLKGIVQLASSKVGGTIIYVMEIEYAPSALSPEQAKVIDIADDKANSMGEFIDIMQKVAKSRQEFSNIPNALIQIREFGAELFDFQSDNFRLDKSGMVVLVDPSVPNLQGAKTSPQDLMFEEHLALALIHSIA